MLCSVFHYVGIALSLFYAAKISWALFVRFFAPSKIAQFRQPDSWAVITGGSDGIGLGLAKKFLLESFNVVIVGRNQTKLEETVSKLKLINPNCKVEYRICDAKDTSDKNISNLINSLKNLKITVFVSNVGVDGSFGKKFEELTSQSIEEVIAINCTFTVKSTQAFVSLLKREKKSLLMITSSIAALNGFPFLSVYSATKGFDRVLGLSLASELSEYGITVQVVNPGTVVSQMVRKAESWSCCSSVVFAESVFKTIGWERDSVPFPPHLLISAGAKFMTSALPDKLVRKIILEENKSPK